MYVETYETLSNLIIYIYDVNVTAVCVLPIIIVQTKRVPVLQTLKCIY